MRDITSYKDAILFISSNTGVHKFDLKNEKFETIHNFKTTRPSYYGLNILADTSGFIWFSGDYGLTVYDMEMETKKTISEKDGLLSNIITAMEIDNSGNLWISSKRGLTKYNPQTETFKNYGMGDGLRTYDFSYWSHYKNELGEIYFGTFDGFVVFHPDSIKESNFIPNVILTEIKINNEKFEITKNGPLKRSIFTTEEIVLDYDQNDISLSFASLDYTLPFRNLFSYMLENYDPEWRPVSPNYFAEYTNLIPGDYVFKVKGSNSDGVWNENPTMLKIIILPPWWKTWWAYSFYVLIALGLLYSLRRYELNRTQLKTQVKLDEVKLREKEETEKIKSTFFANISHEFRTPLTLILGPAEKIEKNESENPVKDAGIITRNSKRLLQLVNQLLDLSKLDSGKLKLETSPGNIVSFIKGHALSFESLAESRDIMIRFKSDKEFVEIYFDREKMVKILSNLLSNALKFTPEGENVIITIAETLDDTVEIKIKNTGIGIPQNEVTKLFDRFYQVDSSQTKEYEGTGIGLALVKELVELHHGSITVDSEIGKWTEFKIKLPLGRAHLKDEEILTKDETPDQKEIPVEEEEFYNLNTSTESDLIPDDSETIILVVEDNYDMREYIKESLSDSYIVEEAINGEQGVRIAEKIIPDLIISDLMMPKMDGNELTRILKNDERTSHIPIIILTAKSGQENKIEGLLTGADDYLTKPFDLQELQVRVKNLISIRKELQKKFSKEEFLSMPAGKKLKSLDETFLTRVIEVIEKHLSDEDFSIEECSSEVGMSRTHLHKKLKALVGKSPSQYVRSVRLYRAKQMIGEERGNISEIAYSVGFSSLAYFSKCFKDEFGFPPSDILS